MLNCVFTNDAIDKIKLITVNKKCDKCDKKSKNLRTGSNNKTIPKTICLAIRYNEAPVAP